MNPDNTDVEGRASLKIINDFALTILELNSVDEVLWGVARNVISRMGFEDCVIYLLDKEKGELIQKAAFGPKNPVGEVILSPIGIPLGQGISGTVGKTWIGEIIADTALDERYLLDDHQRNAEICVPIIYQEELIGVLDSEHSQKNFFTPDHFQLLTIIASMMAVKIARLQARDMLLDNAMELRRTNKELIGEIEDRKKKEDELKAINAELNTFIYKTSHDIRGPLSSVMGLIELAKMEPDPAELLDYFKHIDGRLKHLDALLIDLLGVTRIKEGIVEPVLVNFEEILKGILMSIEHMPGFTNLQIETDFRIEKDYHADKHILTTMLHNLIVNGVKYSDAKKQPPFLKIKIQSDAAAVEIEIEDNGIGIPNDCKKRVFDMFYRATQKSEGSGLGLYIVDKSVKRLGGEIRLESQEKEGSTFFIQLPSS